jgi:hypothetical protein
MRRSSGAEQTPLKLVAGVFAQKHFLIGGLNAFSYDLQPERLHRRSLDHRDDVLCLTFPIGIPQFSLEYLAVGFTR